MDIVLFMFQNGCELCFGVPAGIQGCKNNNLFLGRENAETRAQKGTGGGT